MCNNRDDFDRSEAHQPEPALPGTGDCLSGSGERESHSLQVAHAKLCFSLRQRKFAHNFMLIEIPC